MPPRHVGLALLVVLIWGVNFVVIHAGLAGMPPLLFAAIRFLAVAPAALFLPRPAARWRDLAAVGLFMSAGQFAFLYSAMAAGLPAGLASLVLQAQVMFTILFASVWLHERPTRQQLLGVLIGTTGLAVVAVGRQASTPILALGLSMIAAASWALGNVAARRVRASNGLALTAWAAVFAPLPLLAASLVVEGPAEIGSAFQHITWAAVASTAYTAALSTLVAYGIWNTLLAKHSAASVAPFTLLVPVIGMASALVFLREVPNAWELAGGALLLAGVATTVFKRRRRPTPPTSEAAQQDQLIPRV